MDSFGIHFEGPQNSKRFTINIGAEIFSVIRERRVISKAGYPLLKGLFPQSPFLGFYIHNSGIGILRIAWFQNDVLKENGELFKPFVDSVFKEIRRSNVGRLIIDVRNNGGGESVNATWLYSCITDKPFRFLYAMEANRQIYLSDSIGGVKYMPAKTVKRYISIDTSAKDSRFFGLDIQQPHPDHFSGKLVVLIDGLTVSAATQFADLVKLNKRGKLVGEESPGAINGGSGRGYAYFQLPNTGLLAMISKYRLYMTDPGHQNKDQLLKPDFVPLVKIGDLINGKDNALELAIKMLLKSN